MAELDLLPCPFCGGKAKMTHFRVAEDAVGAQVRCKDCGSSGEECEDAYAPFDVAADVWNRRAPQSPLPSEREG